MAEREDGGTITDLVDLRLGRTIPCSLLIEYGEGGGRLRNKTVND